MRAEPWPIIAMPPTTTKSTPWATRRWSSAPSLNSGHVATALSRRERERADVHVASLERLQPLSGLNPQLCGHERLVDARLVRSGFERQLAAAGTQCSLERRDARVRAIGFELG